MTLKKIFDDKGNEICDLVPDFSDKDLSKIKLNIDTKFIFNENTKFDDNKTYDNTTYKLNDDMRIVLSLDTFKNMKNNINNLNDENEKLLTQFYSLLEEYDEVKKKLYLLKN